MSMRSQVLVEHHGVATGKEMTTWQTLRRGVELHPSCARASGSRCCSPCCRPLGRVLVPSSSSASPTTASSPPAVPTWRSSPRYIGIALVGVVVTACLRLLRQHPPLPVVRERSGDVAAQGVPSHPRPRDADPEHRAARVARLPRDVRRRHDLDVRAVRRAHAADQHRADHARDGAHGRLQPAARPRRVALLRAAVRHHPQVPGHRRPGLHAGARARRRHARRDLRGRRRRPGHPRLRRRGPHGRAHRRRRRGAPQGRHRRPGPLGRRVHVGPARLRSDDRGRPRRRHDPRGAREPHPRRAARLPLPRQPLHAAGAAGHRDPQRDAERRRRLAPRHRHHRHAGRRLRPRRVRRRRCRAGRSPCSSTRSDSPIPVASPCSTTST